MDSKFITGFLHNQEFDILEELFVKFIQKKWNLKESNLKFGLSFILFEQFVEKLLKKTYFFIFWKFSFYDKIWVLHYKMYAKHYLIYAWNN